MYMDDSIVFGRWRQCAHHLIHFLGPTQVHILNGVLIDSAVFAQLTSDCPTLYNREPLPPQNCSFAWGNLDPDLMWFTGPTPLSITNGISIGSAIFAQLTAESLYFTMGHCFRFKIAPSHGGSGPHLIHGSLGPHEYIPQRESQLIQLFLQESQSWQTDRQTTLYQ